MELLAPAGNFDCLKAAISSGASEVYIGVNGFNARNNVDGFTESNIESAIDLAHLFNVKIFLALNVLIKDGEMQDAVNLAVLVYNKGIDAIIIQDLGLASLLNKFYPEIPLHASTQLGVHNLEGAKYLKKLGFKRVVLSRETSLSEIERISKNCEIEIEYFVHGALCVSFSGNCYLSSYLFNASGNRGRCKQPCRLNCELKFKGTTIKSGHLLSPKDFSMINRLKDLQNAGVTSLKIEGRARRPFYVKTVTENYAKALKGLKIDYSSLLLAFNRGFTEGYFNGNDNIISGYSGHVGVKIGQVEKFKKGNKFNEIFIRSSLPILKKFTLKFYDKNNKTEACSMSAQDVKQIEPNLYRVTGTTVCKPGYSVHLISDGALEEEMLKISPKRDIEIKVSAFENLPIKAEVKIAEKVLTIFGETLSTAKTKPVFIEDVKNCFLKTENFNPIIDFVSDDKCFIVKSQLNAFRRKVYSEIANALTQVFKKNLKPIILSPTKQLAAFTDFIFIEDLSEINSNKTYVYSPEEYSINGATEFIRVLKKNGAIGYLDTPNFATKESVEILEDIINKTGIKIVANNLYAMQFNTEKIIGGGLNVFNVYTAELFNSKVIKAEGEKSIKFQYMTLRHCPFKNNLGANCNKCPYEKGYSYRLENGKELKLKRKKLSDCTFYLTD